MSDEFDAFYKHAEDEMFPKMKASAVSLIIFNAEPDPKLAMELGAAILYNKPIIVLGLNDCGPIPEVLARIASAVIVGNMTDPDIRDRITSTLKQVIQADPRAQ